MDNQVNVGAKISRDYKNLFQKRCIDYNTNMADVIKDAIKNFLESHPPISEKYQGVT